VPRVRCVAANGEMVGVVSTSEALRLAQQQGLDLVEISPKADPPVCRIMDFGKYRYDESVKQKLARKRAHKNVVKEIKFHANVGDHDYQTKMGHVRKFLEKGHKVKLSLQFRGRENAHRELGFEVINRAIVECEDVCSVDMLPKLVGRNIVTMLSSKSAK
jgi:translation initiation factor IF-3